MQSIAATCGISTRYVHMLMRGTGRTFSQYLLEHRLECCRNALQVQSGKRRSITEIAFEYGFNDGSHFSRTFRNRYGKSLREFRRKA
ncbi:MAG: helix-turn-helix transcriptional regulator [Betaproteobacteria bacterium]|nr:helix-turn-helix transcriptional regulator [Betaproteobacteria bacterium]